MDNFHIPRSRVGVSKVSLRLLGRLQQGGSALPCPALAWSALSWPGTTVGRTRSTCQLCHFSWREPTHPTLASCSLPLSLNSHSLV
jgi:hypothetical protein